jgi:CBS domain-containing protein
MQIGKMKTTQPACTGQLLASAGIISSKQLDEAISTGRRLRMPIGRVLMMAGHLNQRNLDSVLMAQQLVREEQLELDSAVQLLSEASRDYLPLDEVLSRNGWQASNPSLVSELGEVMVSATLLSRQDLWQALRETEANFASLGRYIIDHNMVRITDVMNALRALASIRHEEVPRESAINALRISVASAITYDQALRKAAPELELPETLKFGELLSTSGLISDVDLIDALEISLSNKAMLGEVLVAADIIDRTFLHCLLDIQDMVDQGAINNNQAKELVLSVYSSKKPLSQCVHELEKFCDGVLALLRKTEIVSESDIKNAAEHSEGQLLDLPEILFEQNYIDRTMLDIARRCQRMIDEGFIPVEQAVLVLATYKLPPGVERSQVVTSVHEVITGDQGL